MEKTRDKFGVIPTMSQVLHLELDWNLPDSVFEEEFDKEGFKKSLKELGILSLYQQRKIGPGHAAQLLGLTREEFIILLAEKGFSYADLTPEQLDKELETGKKVLELLRKTKK